MRLCDLLEVARKAEALKRALDHAYHDPFTGEFMIQDLPAISKPH